MKKDLSRTEVKNKIEDFFIDIQNKSPKEIKKIKTLAMKYNLPLKEKRKLFCKECFSPKIKIKKITKEYKIVECDSCGKINRFKLS